MAVTFVPTVRLRNLKTGDIMIYNADDVVRNPSLADGFEVVAHGMGDEPVVSLPADRFATADDYLKPEWPETPITARADDAPMTSTKKRGRPAKGE